MTYFTSEDPLAIRRSGYRVERRVTPKYTATPAAELPSVPIIRPSIETVIGNSGSIPIKTDDVRSNADILRYALSLADHILIEENRNQRRYRTL